MTHSQPSACMCTCPMHPLGFRAFLACSHAVLCHWQVGLITDIFANLLEAFASPHAHPCILAYPNVCMPTRIPAVPTRHSAKASSSTVFDIDSKLSRYSSHSSHLHITRRSGARRVLYYLLVLQPGQQIQTNTKYSQTQSPVLSR